MSHAKIRLVSGRIPVTNALSVTADRYNFLDLSSAEPNLGVAPANNYVLAYNTNTLGNRTWIQISIPNIVTSNLTPNLASTWSLGNTAFPFLSVYANNFIGVIDAGSF